MFGASGLGIALNLINKISNTISHIGRDIGELRRNTGNVSNLKTENKESVVNAINELIEKGLVHGNSYIDYVVASDVNTKFIPSYFASKPKGFYLSLIHSNNAGLLEVSTIQDFLLVTTYNTYGQANRLVQTAISVRNGNFFSRGTTESGEWGLWKQEKSMVPIREEIYDEGWIKVSRQKIAEMNGIPQNRNGVYELANGRQYKILYDKTYDFKPIPLIIAELGGGNFITYSGQYLNDHFLFGVNYGAAIENIYYRVVNDPENIVTKSDRDYVNMLEEELKRYNGETQ